MSTYSTSSAPSRIERLKADHLTHVKAAQAVFANADAEGRDITEAEHQEAAEHYRRAKESRAALDQAKADEQMKKTIRDLGEGIGLPGPAAADTGREPPAYARRQTFRPAGQCALV